MKLVKPTDQNNENQAPTLDHTFWGDSSVPPPSLEEADAADADFTDE